MNYSESFDEQDGGSTDGWADAMNGWGEDMTNKLVSLDTLELEFRDALDEQGVIVVCGIQFDRSDILRKLDPIAYSVAFDEFLDAMGVEQGSMSVSQD